VSGVTVFRYKIYCDFIAVFINIKGAE
jgi:hypothetical protein